MTTNAASAPSPHEQRMSRCLQLARNGAGYVSPNPLVGAVLVSPEGQILGEGWHGRYGGPHAEVWAIRDARKRHAEDEIRRATLYVNLEPCSHHGKTPPCADLVVDAGIPTVVVGMIDPFPGVAGRGLERLRAAGIQVIVGVLEVACRRLNEAFTHLVETGRPLVTLKIGQTLDGRVATRAGDSRWITGAEARALVHRWRSEQDAVLIGSGTARCDDPALTVRHVEGRQPFRIVVDGRGELSPDLRVFSDEHAAKTIAVCRGEAQPPYERNLAEAGGRLLRVGCRPDGYLDVDEMLDRLGESGGRDGLPLQSVLVEAGPNLAAALLKLDLVDRCCLFIAPRIMGEGIPSVGELGTVRIDEALSFPEVEWERVGPDMLFRGYRRTF